MSRRWLQRIIGIVVVAAFVVSLWFLTVVLVRSTAVLMSCVSEGIRGG